MSVASTRTIPLYLGNSKLYNEFAQVTAIKKNEEFKGKSVTVVSLSQTIFHPQGGGQRSDKGTIAGIKVDFVSKRVLGEINDFEIDHIFFESVSFVVGDKVEMVVDEAERTLNMRLHSAGHAIAAYAVANFGVIATGGHHFPGEARMTFQGTLSDKENFRKGLENTVNAAIADKVSATITNDKQHGRALQIGTHPAVPCGGTHVENLSEIGGVVLRSVKEKKGEITVGYDVVEMTSSSPASTTKTHS